MQPNNDYRNGDACGEEATEAGDGELTFEEPELVPAALRALNTMRKNRQFYDVVLHTGNVEVPAHRAVLAAVSPYLFELFTTDQDRSAPNCNATLPLSYKLNGICEKSALKALVDYAYTGKLTIASRHVRAVYLCAWQLRMDGVVSRCGDYLVSSLCVDNCIEVRSLPGLSAAQLAVVDKFIADNFSSLYGGAALSGVDAVRLEVLGLTAGGETAAEGHALAALAFHWLKQELQEATVTMSDLMSRTHLLYVGTDRSLRDCAALPPARTDAPSLQEYRRKAAQQATIQAKASKKNGCNGAAAPVSGTAVPASGGARPRVLLYTHDIAERHQSEPDWKVIASDKVGENTYLFLGVVGGPLVQVSVCARASETPLPSPAPLSHDPLDAAGGDRVAHMERPRCAHGTAVFDDTLIVCGGYDRIECLKSCEQYDPERNTWSPLPDMRQARGRFNVAKIGNKIIALGGSDGHMELDSVEVLELPVQADMSASVESVPGSDHSGEESNVTNAHANGTNAQIPEKSATNGITKKKLWSKRARMPLARSHAAVCGVENEDGGQIYCVGGWDGQVGVRDCHVYQVNSDTWEEMAPLVTGRHQAGACAWAGYVWVLGGCNVWHCLPSTERIAIDADDTRAGNAAGWHSGPSLPTARRSVAAVVWRDRLVVMGGSDGASSLRTVDILSTPDGSWNQGPQLREPRSALGAAVVKDRIYAVGGFSGKLFLSSMEYLSEPDGEWTTLLVPANLTRTLTAPASAPPPREEENRQDVAPETAAEATEVS